MPSFREESINQQIPETWRQILIIKKYIKTPHFLLANLVIGFYSSKVTNQKCEGLRNCMQ